MPELDEEFDLIVIGGGPSGSTVSTLVAMQGHSVLLLEKETFPRHQIGESLLPLVVHGICGMLGCLDDVHDAGFVKKYGGVFRWGSSDEPWSFTFGDAEELKKAGVDYSYQVERAKFDHILLNNAKKRGVQVRENHEVKDLIVENGRVVGANFVDDTGTARTARARFVVDASGNKSQFHKYVGERVVSKFFQNIALFGYFENAKRLPDPNRGNILCSAFEHGWMWFIPLSDTLTSVGAVVDKNHAAALQQQDHDAAMRGFIDACPVMQDMLEPATRITEGEYGKYRVRKDYSYSTTSYWTPGMALLGDAACFIDPVLSSGVHLATYSGLLAARSINSLLQGVHGLDEEKLFAEFENRYRYEFENIYRFLIAFYDFNRHEKSYFWEARKILDTPERDNEAFVRLVSGVSTVDMDVFSTGQRISDLLQSYPDQQLDEGVLRAIDHVDMAMKAKKDQVLYGKGERQGVPDIAGGLVPTPDGYYWTTA
ncbi:FAD-dependent oxidoreductase [Actinophytocola sp.]|uniref:FAD-dependent oxidoreductase n=1 Tax=Actinophytocola sp. TaxID=1872138 RepID=UPI003D6A4730